MPFSFVHASDLRLGAPLFAVADLPDELRGRILDARCTAARRVVDLAIGERVDAVVLAGGVIAPSAAPRAMRFFADQCERLDAAGIDVFWCEADADQQSWMQFVPLPDNVALCGPDVGQTFECSRRGRPAAQVLAGEPAQRRTPGDPDLPRIGIVPRAAGRILPEGTSLDYRALGGRSTAGAIPSTQGLAQFSGTTQGASPAEPGPRGCLLVHADSERRLTTRFVPTAGVEWRDECIHVDPDADWESVHSELMERVDAITRAATSDAVLVRWAVRGHGIIWRQLLREDVNSHLLDELRSEFHSRARPVWSLFIEAVEDTQQPDGRSPAPAGRTISIHEPHASAELISGRRGSSRQVEELSWLR